MKIMIAGGSGFVGSYLGPHLQRLGHHTVLLTRQQIKETPGYSSVVTWDDLPAYREQDIDVIINLCGYDIAKKRWSEAVKQKIIQSRVEPTQKLIRFIGDAKTWLINASAIGFYPFGDERQDETHILSRNSQNQGFSQEVTHLWESEVDHSNLAHKTIARFGVVLGSEHGMLSKLKPSVKFGLGAKVGSGKQWLTWIHIEDLCRAFECLLEVGKEKARARYNFTAPEPCTQKDFIKQMAQAYHRPQFMALPKYAVKILFGEMGKELLLSSQRILPKQLLDTGFNFKYSKIDQALKDLCHD